jgi:chaperonin cofactor prefoldin
MVQKTPFECYWLNDLSTPTENKEELLAFQVKVDRLRKAVDAFGEVMDKDKERLKFIKAAIKSYPNLDITLLETISSLEDSIDGINILLYGDPSLSSRDIEQKESIASKVGIIIWNMWRSRSNPTMTNEKLYQIASTDFEKLITEIQNLDNSIKEIETYLEKNEVPFTPGRGLILNWKKE